MSFNTLTYLEEHYQALCEVLGVDRLNIPSHSTFRRIMMGLDFVFLCKAVEDWMLGQQQTHSPDNYVTGMDGKRIRQGLSDEEGKQRFVGLVSLFAVESGITLKLEALTQQDNSELKVVQTLLETLQLKGKLITMDALHAQKNAAANC